MLQEERQLLTNLFSRIRAAENTPRDRDAESFVAQATNEQPYAAYYLAQAVIVQEKGLEAADAHICQLEERVRELEAADREKEQGGGFLNSIFGSGPRPTTATRQPELSGGPWGHSASPWPAQPAEQQLQAQTGSVPSAGSSFLRGALGTAAGVAGGMLLANSLGSIFSSHMASSGWGSPFTNTIPGNAPVEETVINNYYVNDVPQAPDSIASNDNGFDQADYDDDFGSDTSDA